MFLHIETHYHCDDRAGCEFQNAGNMRRGFHRHDNAETVFPGTYPLFEALSGHTANPFDRPQHIDQCGDAARAHVTQRPAALQQVLAESDSLVDEVIQADVLVLGVPLYNYSYPAAFKAWIDQIVRVERTIYFDPANIDHPVGPLLNDRPRHAVILSSRGGFGLGAGGPLAHMNHLEASVRTALELIGIEHFHEIAIEYQEEGGERLDASVRNALAEVERLVARLQRDAFPVPQAVSA